MRSGIYNNGISAAALKIIAVATMLIDHITIFLYAPIMRNLNLGLSFNIEDDFLYMLGRGIGRLSYPLFCFMISEGACHTKNRIRYAVRIGLFAVISTPIFNLAKYLRLGNGEELNVMFGLLLGLLTIMLLDAVIGYKPDVGFNMKLIKRLLSLGIVASMCSLSIFMHIEYSVCSVLLIIAFYYAQKTDHQENGLFLDARVRQIAYGAIALMAGIFIYFFFFTIQLSDSPMPLVSLTHDTLLKTESEICALAAFIPIWYYNGSLGERMPRYLFYAFYPAHLLVLGLIQYVIK